ncbi:hypothetical protein CC2G_013310 [Coprinopsis cinerea AmutBmut pab1-1]|nr:hypothetical protein CC2G_013310 [Coprinopsis cinerea AmutBmut pab1-1]
MQRVSVSGIVAGESAGSAGMAPRNQKFWFEDGNIVLQVENVQFCVHKGVLTRHSVVLDAMISVLRPAIGDAQVDGRPLVRLWGNAVDWVLVLGQLYDGFKQRLDSPIMQFPLVRAMIQLGYRYDFQVLKEKGLEYLSQVYPSTLAEFSSNVRAAKAAKFFTDDITIADVINLTVSLGLKKIMPVVFLLALHHSRYPSLSDWPRGTKSSTTECSSTHSRTSTPFA